jgi:hypothetical protein
MLALVRTAYIALASGFIAIAVGATAPAPTPQDNAAPLWRAAFDAAGVGRADSMLASDDMNWAESVSFPLTDGERARMADIMDRTAAVRQQFEAAARVRRCDWDLDRSKGFALELPHLQGLRSAARLLRLQAMWELDEGRTDSALSTLGALGNVGVQTGQDHIVVSSLVGTATNSMFVESANTAIDQGAIDSKTAKVMLEAMPGLRAPDPFDFAAAVAGEGPVMAASINGLKDDAALRELLSLAGSGSSGRAADLSLDEAKRQAADMQPLYERAARAFAGGDPNAAMEELRRLERGAESGRYGELAKMLMPSLTSMYKAKLAAQQDLAILFAKLQALAEEKEKPADLKNAALPLARASASVRSLPADLQEGVELLRLAPDALDAAQRPRVLEAIERSRPRLGAALEDAASCKRCDFAILRMPEPGLDVRLLSGIRGAVRMTLADALRVAHERRDANAVASAAVTAFRVGALLASDPSTMRAAVGHAIWRDASAALLEAARLGPIGKDERTRLEIAAASMPGGDPFGFRKAMEADALRIAGVDRWTRSRFPEALEMRAQVEKQRGAAAVFAAVAFASIQRGDALPAADDPMLIRVTDLLPLEALQRVATAVDQARARRTGDDGGEPEVPWDLPIEEQRARYRKLDPMRGVQFVDVAQLASNAAADYAAAFDAIKAAASAAVGVAPSAGTPHAPGTPAAKP